MTLEIKKRTFEAGARREVDVKFLPVGGEDLAKLLQGEDIPDGYIAGYASTPDIDHIGDKVLSGAFDEAIAAKGLNGPKGIKLLAQHRSDQPAGIIHKLEQRPEGLWLEGQMNLEISYVKDLYEAAKMNGGLSFSIGYRLLEGGFRFVEKEDPSDSYWELSKLDLHEVSVVTFPCNEEATMTFIKSGGEKYDGIDKMADLEKALVADPPHSRNEANSATRAVKRIVGFETEPTTPEPPMLASNQKADISAATKRLKEMFS